MTDHELLGILVALSIVLTIGNFAFLARELRYISLLVEQVLNREEEILNQVRR
ncbi:MAG TPA: hypothetical protein VGX03_20340 [Candidatus Binatia bacterium]|jgi:hypothetical protein|nr:hypothetical protein [Candidatus Binatia bacterium]